MAFKEMGIRHNSLQNQLLERQYSRNLSPSKMNLSNLKPINEQQPHQGQDGNSFIGGTSNKELNVDFEQAFKKMNRVKDNFSTHKKFMDIVKSKSMKALNRKSSSSSLSSHNINQQADLFPLNLPHESRCSVPPDYRSGSVTAPRAKSMSKEPLLTRENSTASQKSSNSSVFHSLSRRIAKFRSSSTQPRNDKDYSIDDPDYDSNTDLANINEKARSMSKQISQVSQVSHDESHLESDSVTQADLDQEKKSKDRTLSPKKLLKGLRARSPFARKQTSNSDLQKASSLNPTTTTMVSGSKVRSFTVGSNELDKSDSASSANGISRQIRATTAGPTLKPTNSVTSADSQLKSNRSASYEFIDKHQNDSPHNLNKLNETLDNHSDISIFFNNIASIYENRGDYQKALEYLIKSLEIKKEILPSKHLSIADSYNNIGSIYFKIGNFDNALKYYSVSIKIKKEILPDNHKDISKAHNSLGLTYFKKGDLDKALEYYLKSLEIQKLSFPSNYPDIAMSFNNIGDIYYKKGENRQALEYYF